MKKSIILIIVIIIGVVIGLITLNNKNKEKNTTTFDGEETKTDVILKDIEFKNIKRDYENGVTSIKADVYNNTKAVKNINVKIILKDESGKEIKSMIQVIENIEPGSKKILQTGIMGNYIEIKDIEFKVLSDKEINEINK